MRNRRFARYGKKVCYRIELWRISATVASVFQQLCAIRSGSVEREFLAEQALEAAVTIRFVALLFERALLQLLQTIGANKVLRVKLLEHGRYAATCNKRNAELMKRGPTMQQHGMKR